VLLLLVASAAAALALLEAELMALPADLVASARSDEARDSAEETTEVPAFLQSSSAAGWISAGGEVVG
jgi:hypothetical protein